MKQTKLWLITIVTLLCSLTANAHDFEVGGIYYKITSSADLTVGVTYRGDSYKNYSNEYSGAVTIPSTVTYDSKTYSVTSIGSSAFGGCSSLTSITIPASVTNIDRYVLNDCTSLKEVIFEDGSEILTLGYNSYSDYTGEGLFYDCPLESVYLGRNLSYSIGRSYGYSPFYNKGYLTTLTIGKNVTSIKGFAFYGCRGLTSITIPASVTNIDSYVLDDCTSLKEVIFEDGCETLTLGHAEYNLSGRKLGLFYYCPLVNIYLGRNLSYDTSQSYYYSPFYEKVELSTLTIGKNVTNIGKDAFYGCSNLTSITIPESVTSIGYSAFYGCSSLTNIHIGSLESWLSIKYAGDGNSHPNYFSGDVKLYIDGELLTEVEIPSTVTSIPSYAFYNCRGLTSITIPEGVTSIGSSAFEGCSSLTSITIPEGVTSIGSNAFSTPEKVIWLTNTPPSGYANAKGSINYVANDQYTSLSNVKAYPYLSSMFEVDGVKYVPVSPSERTCHAIDCAYDSTATVINVGETVSFKGVAMKVTEVMPYTFYGNDHIKEVSVSHLGNIGDYAFYDCDAIETVNVSNQGNIGYQAFYNCDATEIVAVSNQGSIGSQAFYDCNGIKSVDIRNQGSIDYQAFYRCNGMKTVNIANKGAVGSEAFSGCSSLKTVTLGNSIESLGDKAFYQCSSLQEIAVPDSVKSVGSYCFSGCSAMKSVAIGNGLRNIKEYTFEDCTALADVTVGDRVTAISNYAFTGCSSLTNVALGRKVATINNYAFQGCSSLPEITLPQAVTKVGDYVFAGCNKLADLVIADRTTALALGSNGSSPLFADCPLDSVYIGGKITYSTANNEGYSPFYRNTSLRTVVITDREEQIYDNEFYGCTNLKNVTIGNGVKSIGDFAFSGCSSLDKFAFGSSMQHIGEEAFSDCTNMTEICSSAINPPTCGTQALDDINKWNCTLKVPIGYQSAYMAADQWKEFFFIEDVIDGVDQLIYDSSKQPTVIYDLNGRKVLDADKIKSGIYILNGKKVVIK